MKTKMFSLQKKIGWDQNFTSPSRGLQNAIVYEAHIVCNSSKKIIDCHDQYRPEVEARRDRAKTNIREKPKKSSRHVIGPNAKKKNIKNSRVGFQSSPKIDRKS